MNNLSLLAQLYFENDKKNECINNFNRIQIMQ